MGRSIILPTIVIEQNGRKIDSFVTKYVIKLENHRRNRWFVWIQVGFIAHSIALFIRRLTNNPTRTSYGFHFLHKKWQYPWAFCQFWRNFPILPDLNPKLKHRPEGDRPIY